MDAYKHQGWLFTFAALGGFGGLACIFQFIVWVYELKPADVRSYMHIGWPGWMWLICGLALFAVSITLSAWSLRANLAARRIAEREVAKGKAECVRAAAENQQTLDNARRDAEHRTAEWVKHTTQEKNAAIAGLKKEHAEEIERIKKEHATELGRVETPLAPAPSSLQLTQKSEPIFPSLSALHNQEPQITFNAHEYFRTAYYSPVTTEIGQDMRIVAHQYDPNNPEVFYTRLIGVGAAAFHYELAWALIFKSQLDLLAELNRAAKRLPISVARKHYDEATKNHPDIYPKYGFDAWLAYLQGQSLVVRYPSDTAEIPDMVEITHLGRDFLKYLAHWGRDVTTKKG